MQLKFSSLKDNYEHEIFFKEFFILQRLEHPSVIEAFEIGKVVHSMEKLELKSVLLL